VSTLPVNNVDAVNFLEIWDMNTIKQATHRSRITFFFSFAAGTLISFYCAAAELTVNIKGLTKPYGTVACSLFDKDEGFPMEITRAKTEWILVSGDSGICRIKDVAPGKFAIAIAHDLNGNRQLDTNFFGVPTEQWGVSNNVRPTMRAPRYNEAAFTISSDTPTLSMDIEVAK